MYRCRLTRAGSGLLGLAATSASSVSLAPGLCIGADVLEGGSVAVVEVNTGELTTVFGGDALHVDVTLALLGALSIVLVFVSEQDLSTSKCRANAKEILSKTHVSARAVQLAVVLSVEVNNIHSTAAVVLNDLVRGVVGTTTDNPSLVTRLVILDTDGVLAHVPSNV